MTCKNMREFVTYLSEQNSEMTKSPHSHDSNTCTRSCAIFNQRGIHGHSSAKHGRRFFRFQSVGNLENEMTWYTGEFSVASIGLATVRIFPVVRPYVAASRLTMILNTICARLAIRAQAGSALSADAHTVTNENAAGGLGSNTDGGPNDFMANTDRIICWTPNLAR